MISRENFKRYRDSLIKNEDKIVLAIGFILVAILSFGAGKLSQIYRDQTPIIFQDNANCAKSQASISGIADDQNKSIPADTQGKIIGNKNSKIYHIPGGGSYGKISEENRVYFATEADAQKAGFRKARN